MNGITGHPPAPLARSLDGGHLLGTRPVDRDHALPADTDPSDCLEDPNARILVLRDGRAPARPASTAGAGAASRTVLAWQSPEQWRSRRGPAAAPGIGLTLLGRADDGAPVLLDHLPGAPDPDLEAGDPWAADSWTETGLRWLGLREAAADLPAEDSTWFAVALALANWLDTSAYCPVCGSPAPVVGTGWSRRCSAEGREIFPRTDPAIITAVVHTDDAGTERLLLGHSAHWPAGRYSTFAGFVEAGESLESAVAREVREESGVQILSAEYLGSQPWPFPRSLMLGFRAAAASLDTRPDGVEITEVRWCTRAELKEAAEAGEILLPGPVSIAHHLIRDWYGGPLPEPQPEPDAAPQSAGPARPEEERAS